MLSITSEYQDQVFAKYHKTSILDFSSILSGFAGVLTRQNYKENTINQSGSFPADGEHVKTGGTTATELGGAGKEVKTGETKRGSFKQEKHTS